MIRLTALAAVLVIAACASTPLTPAQCSTAEQRLSLAKSALAAAEAEYNVIVAQNGQDSQQAKDAAIVESGAALAVGVAQSYVGSQCGSGVPA